MTPRPLLTVDSLPRVQAALREQEFDGWLLYDFRGLNPIARAMLGLEGMQSRRIFAWVPAEGVPVAITHAIEQGPWSRWPAAWERRVYASWRDFEADVALLVEGKRIAMEYSPGDAVPVVDRVPAGVLEMVRAAGARVATSAELVSRFFAVWTAEGLVSHRRSAEHLARIAREAFARIGSAARSGQPLTEYEVVQWIRGEFRSCGIETDHGPNVSATENAANPHYEPGPDTPPRPLRAGDAVLIDLWAGEPGHPQADQTWMASIGEPTPKLLAVWTAVRDARDAALTLIRSRVEAGIPVRGADADDAARRVIDRAGLGAFFTHRTGHSIDARDLHGSGPNLDNLETREERLLIAGVGFSVEPGVYIPGEFGVRSEVNCWVGDRELVVTPGAIQQDLIVV
jgi:Xaa-Pro aminopeptidase